MTSKICPDMAFNVFSSLLFLLYFISSYFIFNKVYDTSQNVIDEKFHIPQGLQYCKGNFSYYDPKITTLPGLYIVSTVLLYIWGKCTVFWLRFVNLTASAVNFIIIEKLLCIEFKKKNKYVFNKWKLTIASFNIAIFPPLYFFSHLYYTDTLSLTFVLCLFLFASYEKHVIASIAGSFSIMIRQTNVIWVGMVFGHFILNIYLSKCININKKYQKLKLSYNEGNEFSYILNNLRLIGSSFVKMKYSLQKVSKKDWLAILCYLSVLITFLIFILLNGGLVVGDKAAHTANIHIPQLFYFSLFYFIFSFPFIIIRLKTFISQIKSRPVIFISFVLCILLIVHYNTLIHPYLLADNRHYTFYVWNRLYGRYFYVKYIMVFVYIFSIYAIILNLMLANDFAFFIIFLPCLIIALILQKMIEVRYFLLPFIIINLKRSSILNWQLITESVMFLIINFITFKIFFTKEIYWDDFNDIQRLIW